MARRACGVIIVREANLSDPHDTWVISVFGGDPRDFVDAAERFGKGLAEGTARGAAVLAKGVEAAARQGYALATDSDARAAAGRSLVQSTEAAGSLAAGVINDPGGAVTKAAEAVQHEASAVTDAVEGAYGAYKTAAASGAGAEFLGEALGEGAVFAGGALVPGGGEAEAGMLAAEGVEAAGAGAAELTEGLAAADGGALESGAGAADAGNIELDKLASGADPQLPGLEPPNDLPPDIVQHWEPASKAAKDVLAKAGRAEPLLRPTVQRAAESLGGEMRGLEHCNKTALSLTMKIARDMAESGVSAEVAAADVADAVRYTATFAPETLADGAVALLARLQQEGSTIVQLKNSWLDLRPCYKGINVQMRSAGGQMFELQFHTPESYWAKETGTHDIYKKLEKLDPRSPEWARLNVEQEKIFAGLKVPSDIGKIRPLARGR
jgi:hypothetical protein